MRTLRARPVRSEENWGYFFILPQFAGLTLFTIVPVFKSLYISFHQWDFMSEPTWVGLANYRRILGDPYTYKILGNTLAYMLGTIPLTMAFAILLAFALSKNIRGVTAYRTAFFLPNITSTVAVSMVWMWIFNPDMGIVNTALSFLGIQGPGWFASTEWAMPTVVLMSVWQGVGYYMIIFLAGIKGISESYYEAARIDGASPRQCFTRITLPLLTPTVFFVMTMMLINSFQVFNEVYMLTRGGPADATKTIVLEIYNNAFQFFKMGDASVYSWILFVIILTVTLAQFVCSERWVHYDA